MNLVDSCGWLEYFADGANASFFSKPLENKRNLIVPTICILEVFKNILRQRDENSAIQAVSLMAQANVIDLNLNISLKAAKLGVELKLPLADSVILATAHTHKAIIWTQDSDFKDMNGVKYIIK